MLLSTRPERIALALAGLLVLSSSTATSKPPISAEAGTASVSRPGASAPAPRHRDESFGRLPLAFEPNRGQTHKDVKFFTRGPGYQFFLTQKEAVFVFIQREMPPEDPTRPFDRLERTRARREAKVTKSVVRMKFQGARQRVKLAGEDALPGKTNYFIGNDPKKWRTDIPTYRKVRLTGAYDGIDVVFYGNGRHIEYDLIVQPGIDPGKVRVKFDGPGALEKGDDGGLRIATASGALELRRPYLYQEVEGRKVEVAGSYVFDGSRTLAFSAPDYDRERALIIDPQLVYSTYIGPVSSLWGPSIALATNGDTFLTGLSDSINYPTTQGAYLSTLPSASAAYVSKLDKSGSVLVYSTWLGDASPWAIAIDGAGSAYITGGAASVAFPRTPGAFQRPGGVVFVTKLSPAGNSLVYSSVLGGSGADVGVGIALGPDSSTYVTGEVLNSAAFPTTSGAFQMASAPGAAFVTRITPDGSDLIFSTLLNGTTPLPPFLLKTGGSMVRLDPDLSGNVIIAGWTTASDFPTTPGALLRTIPFEGAAVVVKLNATGTNLIAGTYVDSAGPWTGAIDSTGAVYLNPNDAVSKVSGDLSQMVYQIGFPGGGAAVADIAVDATGSAYVVGGTEYNAFPTTPGAFQSQYIGGRYAFLTKVSPDGSRFLYSTLLGGQAQQFGDDSYGTGVAVDSSGNAYVSGFTTVGDFPTTAGSFQRAHSGGSYDAFVAKILPPVLLPAPAISPNQGPSLGGTAVTVTGSGFQPGAIVTLGGVSASVQLVTPTTIQATTGSHPPAVVDLLIANPDDSMAFLANAYTYMCGSTAPTATVSGSASICAGNSTNLSIALTGAAPWDLTWADGLVQSAIASSPATRSVSPTSTMSYSVTTIADANCAGAGSGSATITVMPVPSATIAAPAAICQNAAGLAASVPNAGAGATYVWTIANGTITSGAGTNAVVFSAGAASPLQLDVTVTLNGCSKSGTVSIPVTPAPTATVSGGATICAGQSTTIQAALTGAPPWTVRWSDGVTQSGVAASPATRVVTPSASASYTVTSVGDASSCVGTSSGLADVVVKPAPGALITPSVAQACPGSAGNTASTPDAGVGAAYGWTIANGTITAGAGTRQITFTAGAAGSVTLDVTVTGSNGCSSTDTRVLPIRPTPTAALTGPAAACSGQPTSLSVSLTGQPPWNLRWSDGNVQAIQTSPATRVVTLGADTTFSLTSLTDGSGCAGTVSGSVSINVHAPSAAVDGGGAACSGAAVTISATVTSGGPFTVRWNDGLIQTGSGSTTLTRVVTPTRTTLYKIDAISDGTCSASGSGGALISVGLDPTAAIVTAPHDVCAGSSGATASVPDAGAGASYAWSILNGTIDAGQGMRSVTFTAGDAGQTHLSVVVKAGSGCQVSGGTDVTIDRRPLAPSITAPASVTTGDSGLVASAPATGSDVFTWTVENGSVTSGQGTNTIRFTAGLPGVMTLRVVQKTVNGCSSDAGALRVPVSGLSATRIVPVVVSVAGKSGAQFSSELTFSNACGSSAHVELTLTPADALGGGAGSTVSQDLGPGQQVVIPDALAFFSEHGAARTALDVAASGGGSVRVSFTNLPVKAVVYAGARTTARSGAGRAGLSYPAPAAEEFFNGRVAIYGLREMAAERTNLALENAGTSGPIGLRVTLMSGAGDARFVLPDTVFLQPGQWVQVGSILKVAEYSSGWALVERVSGTDPFYAYGVVNDNATNDGAFLAAVSTTRAPSALVVPAIVETGAFSTELVLANPSLAAATVTLNFVESLASPLGKTTGFVTETLKPGEQRFIPNVVDYLRTHGASVAPKGASYAGPLFVRFTVGGKAADGYVASRTSTPAVGGGGYGVSYPGVTLAESASAEAWVFGLQQNAESRSNFAVLNAAANLGPISLSYEVYDGLTGAEAGGGSMQLYAGQWMQVNSILRKFGLANGCVRVTRTAGTAPWVAYGILNDGSVPGAGTGDGSFIAMTPAP